MSAVSETVGRARFRVVHRVVEVGGREVPGRRWRDFFGRLLTYMAACEEVERLSNEWPQEVWRPTEGVTVRHEYKVMHERLFRKEANS